MTKIVLFAALIACIVIPFRVFVKGEQTKARYKKTLALNGALFFGLMVFTGIMMFSGSAVYDEYNSAALGAISEDSSILGKSLIFVGLAEGVCLYGLIIAFMILGQL